MTRIQLLVSSIEYHHDDTKLLYLLSQNNCACGSFHTNKISPEEFLIAKKYLDELEMNLQKF